MALSSRIDPRCIALIKGWELMEDIPLDFHSVTVKSLVIEQNENNDKEKWVITLSTIMYVLHGDDSGEKYIVEWTFSDLWGNLAFYKLSGPTTKGAIEMEYVDYDDFAVMNFKIMDDDRTVFVFEQPDEVRIKSVRFVGHLSAEQMYAEGI